MAANSICEAGMTIYKYKKNNKSSNSIFHSSIESDKNEKSLPYFKPKN